MHKFDNNTERGKVKNKIWEQRASKNILFFYKYRDKELVYIDILTILSVFPIISMRQIEDLGAFNHQRALPMLFALEKLGCIKIYFNGNEEYNAKKQLLPNLYEKGMIIESMDLVKELYNGAVFEMPKFKKISLSQLKRKNNTPYRVNNKTIIVEITNKGKLVLKKYLELYSRFFNINITKIDTKMFGLFNKPAEELREMIRKDNILALFIQNKMNKDEKKSSHES